MKELSIEEKAKAYDEVVEKLSKLYRDYDSVSNLIDVKEELENILPEIKENEDENIRKGIIRLVKGNMPDNDFRKKYIAWLEKQAEHAKFRDSIQVGDKVTRNKDGVLVNLSQLERVAKKDEKQGEQKPTEWSEEDENMLGKLLDYCNLSIAYNGKGTLQANVWEQRKEWLKSLKDRYAWRPSDEQIKALEYYMHTLTCNEHKEILFGLYTDLKKLREE